MRRFVLFGTGLFLLITVFIFSMAENNNKISIVNPKEEKSMELVFILDRSGSMGGLESDTIGGYNSMMEKQKNGKTGKVNVTTVLFDDKYELLHDRIPIKEIKPITDKEYFVRGNTALLDAIGKTVSHIKSEQNKLEKEKKSEKVMFIIITDGMENASKEYTVKAVKEIIETQKNKEKWEFLFLGANIDAIGTAESYGIDSSRAVQYKSDSRGTINNYEVLEKAIENVREGKELDEKWKKEIEEDVKNRGQ